MTLVEYQRLCWRYRHTGILSARAGRAHDAAIAAFRDNPENPRLVEELERTGAARQVANAAWKAQIDVLAQATPDYIDALRERHEQEDAAAEGEYRRAIAALSEARTLVHFIQCEALGIQDDAPEDDAEAVVD